MAEEYTRNKLWLAIGRCGAFTEDDSFIFRVWPKSEQFAKNKHIDLMPKFIEAQDLEGLRNQAHWFIDKMFNDYAKYSQAAAPAPAPLPEQKWTPPSSGIESLDCLTIEGERPPAKDVLAPPAEKKSDNDGLLNLGDLV